jgi:hypothetical protein
MHRLRTVGSHRGAAAPRRLSVVALEGHRVCVPDAACGLIRATCFGAAQEARSPDKRSASGADRTRRIDFARSAAIERRTAPRRLSVVALEGHRVCAPDAACGLIRATYLAAALEARSPDKRSASGGTAEDASISHRRQPSKGGRRRIGFRSLRSRDIGTASRMRPAALSGLRASGRRWKCVARISAAHPGWTAHDASSSHRRQP